MGDDTPNENPEDLQKFLHQMLGGEKGTGEFFSQIENPMTEAFVGFHEMYLGLQSGGFNKQEALTVLGVVLHQTMSALEEGN